MKKLVSACGLVCSECPAFVATKANDAAAVARIAGEWTEMFHVEIPPEHVWCEGCMTEGPRKCQHTTDCEVRACVRKRGLDNCAACADYGCKTITDFFAMAPQAKETLEALRGRTAP